MLSTEIAERSGIRTYLDPKEKFPQLRGGSNPWCCITHDSEPNESPPGLFWPPEKKDKKKREKTTGSTYPSHK